MTKDEAIKLALEALQKTRYRSLCDEIADPAITALREALAEQPAQQCKWPTCQSEEYQQALAEQIKRELVGEQPAQQEPVALLPVVDVCMRAEAHGIDPQTKGLYGFYVDCISSSPQPAQRTWVGLSGKEWFDICEANNMLMDMDLIHTIEAKLKEKNT